ncbi:f-box/wd-40 repeat-containing protein [Quercus suber]|uniref:F-box/wd-40 repeat-containing protein n=1 Tax=Quercus suber TaxID=58331 RepID=A0AAW0JSU5_QUESU
MEFVCQEGTEDSKKLVSCVENSCVEHIEPNQFNYKLKAKETALSNLTFDSKPENERSVKPKPVSKFHSKKAIVSSNKSKQPLSDDDDALPNFRPSITDLPAALISEILNCLDPKELGIVSCVSESLHRLASEHHVWKEFYCERWGLPIAPTPLDSGFSNEKSWKELYAEREFRSNTMYSGSWDMTVRVWDRFSMKCLTVLRHSDWVWGLAPHDTTVASTSGSDVYIWDSISGTLITIICSAHVGNTYSVARSHTGNYLFTGGEDGAIHMFKIARHCTGAAVSQVSTWIPHSGPVHSLAFEFPWLVSASSDGKLSLIDVRKLLGTCKGKSISRTKHVDKNGVEPPQRMQADLCPKKKKAGCLPISKSWNEAENSLLLVASRHLLSGV